MRPFGAGALGLAVFFAVNAAGVWWLRATEFASDAFYDGCAALLTLVLPALVGGAASGLIARGAGLFVAVGTFALFCVVGFLHPLWRIPLVSPHSVRSGLMHYLLYNPLPALAFGALGGWLGAQFSTGRFSLADSKPILPSDLDD